jgi:hypothetical protein
MMSAIPRALLAMLLAVVKLAVVKLTIVKLTIVKLTVLKLAVVKLARRWSVALRAEGSGARRRTVNGAATKAGRGYRRGRTVDLRVAV